MIMTKVVRIITRLNIGGPAIHTVLLTAGLDKARFKSLLLCGVVSRGEGDMRYYAAERQVKPVYIPQLRRELNLFNDLIAFIKIFMMIKREKPDIIHTHTAKAGALGRIAGIVYNIGMSLPACLQAGFAFGTRNDTVKLIHTFHGHIFEGYFNKFLAGIFITIEKFLAYFSSSIITVSESVKNELISLGICKANKIAVIPLGLELDKFLAVSELTIQAGDCFVAPLRGAPRNDKCEVSEHSRFNIGVVGRLVPIKNHSLFLEAADRLSRSLVNEAAAFKLKFRIVGDGELRSELEEYSRKLNLSQYVEFSGWQKDLAKVYTDLDIVCLSSINEGTPVSLIEAMACGKAIVATEVGGVTDLLGEEIQAGEGSQRDFIVRKRGVTVKSKDVNGFTQALKFMLGNEELRKNFSKAGREYVKDKFARERLIKDTEKLYLKTLKIYQL